MTWSTQSLIPTAASTVWPIRSDPRTDLLLCRYIAEYIGQGNFSPLVVEEVASMTAKEAQSMLHSTFIVQEFMNTFKDFPPRQKAASFTIQQASETLQQPV